MQLTEPMTMLTDYALAGLCLGFVGVLRSRSRKAGGPSMGLWIAAFAVTALAALAGGTAHGLRRALGESWGPLWKLTEWSIALSAVLLIASGVSSAVRGAAENASARSRGIQWLKRAIVVSLIGLAVLVAKLSLHPQFNQNDLYHVVQMAGLYCLYRGALLLHGLDGHGLSGSDSSPGTAH